MKINNILSAKSLLAISIFGLWMSIDTSFHNFKNFDLNLKNFFIYSRIIVPYIFCIILLILLFKQNRKNNIEIKLNYFFYISLFFFLFQTLGIFLTDNSILNLSFIFNSVFFFLVMYLSNYYQVEIYKYLNISMVVLFVVLVIYSFEVFRWFYLDTTELHLYGSWPHSLRNLEVLSSNLPRSSGLARTAMALFIFFSFLYIIKYKKKNLLFSVIFIFLNILILLTQSRIILIFYFGFSIIFFISIFISNSTSIKNKIISILIIFLIPYLFIFASVKYKNNLVFYICCSMDYYTYGELQDDTSNENFENLSLEEIENKKKLYAGAKGEEEVIYFKYKKNKVSVIRPIDPRSFTSFRFEDWSKLINKNKKIVYGYGVMGDRFLVDQTASSGLIYSYSSSGIIGVFLYLLIFFRSLYLSFKYILKSSFKINDQNFKYLTASSLVIFFIFRSIVETSFTIFSIDFMLFFIAMIYLESKKNFISKI